MNIWAPGTSLTYLTYQATHSVATDEIVGTVQICTWHLIWSDSECLFM